MTNRATLLRRSRSRLAARWLARHQEEGFRLMRLYSAASGADLTGFAWLAALADRELAARTGRRLLARARHLLPIWLLPMRLRDLAARRRGLPHLFTADQSQAGADGPDWLSALVRACPPNGPDAAALAELRTPVIIS